MANNFITQITLPDSSTYNIHALQWINGQAVYTDLNTASTTNTINANSNTALAIGVSGTLPISSGGTGTTASPITNGVIYASTNSSYASTTAGTNGQIFIGKGTNNPPAWYSGLILGGTSNSDYIATFSGKIQFTNGTSTTSTYGNAQTPIYWNDGVPATVDIVKKYAFSITNSTTSTITPANSNVDKCIVTEIVIDAGIECLKAPISWSVTTSGTYANKILLSTTTATSGTVSGYILVSTGS